MKKWGKGVIAAAILFATVSCGDVATCKVSLLVIGGGASGTAAGIQAARDAFYGAALLMGLAVGFALRILKTRRGRWS